VRTTDFVWNMSVNTSKNINTLDTDVPRDYSWQNAASGKLYKEGYAVSSFWVFDYKGLDAQNGSPLFNIPQVIDNPKTENDATEYMVYGGRFDPDFTAGFSTSFRFKWLTLSSSFNTALGGKRLLYKMFKSTGLPGAYENMPKEFANRWKQPGDEKRTDIPSIPSWVYGANGVAQPLAEPVPGYVTWPEAYDIYNYSTARVASASFLRCNDLSLSWNIAEHMLRHVGLKSAAVTASVRNPFIIVSKDYKGMDPEVATGNQPIPRVYSMGLNVSF
jgi:hypothetical protein